MSITGHEREEANRRRAARAESWRLMREFSRVRVMALLANQDELKRQLGRLAATQLNRRSNPISRRGSAPATEED